MINIDKNKVLEFESIISSSEKICIIPHMRPDGDAMGSSIGLYHYLKGLNKDAKIVLNDRYPNSLKFFITEELDKNIIDFSAREVNIEPILTNADLIICVDFSAPHRVGGLETMLISSTAKKIVIDHHLNPQIEYFDLVFSECKISSTCELLYNILLQTSQINENPKKLPLDLGYALFVGMTTDTNNFANSVYPSTFKMSSDLLTIGVNRDEIINSLYFSYKEGRIRLMGYLLYENMKITPEGVAYIILDRESVAKYDIQDGETEGFVNLPLNIAEVKMSIFIKEDIDKLRVSVRSKLGTSANKFASSYFNGGGHEQAAGGRLIFGEEIKGIEDAENYILSSINDFK